MRVTCFGRPTYVFMPFYHHGGILDTVAGNTDENAPLPLRTAWHVVNRIREAWEDHTGTEPAPPQEPEQKQDQGPGRPRSMRYPAPIPDSPENIAKALMSGPPKKEWRYLEGDENKQ